MQAVGALPSQGVQRSVQIAHDADREQRFGNLPSLTGLRWSAALLVFLYHVWVVQYFGGHAARPIERAFHAGDVGVSFFFVLSGFVLTWSAKNARAFPFYRRRFARIYPLHIATALLTLLLTFTLLPGTKPTFAQLLTNLTLTQSWVPNVTFYQSVNTVSWSLSCEEFFYIVFPLLLVVLRRFGSRGNALVVAGCIAVDFLVPTFAHHVLPSRDVDFFVYYCPATRLPEFVLGMALALVVRSGRWRGPGVAVSLALTIASYFMSDSTPLNYHYYACTIIGITCLIAAVALADLNGEPSPWRNRLTVRLGELSFAFYMVHLLVIRVGEVVFRWHPQEGWLWGSVAMVSAFASSLALAWILNRLVENPLRVVILSPRSRAKSRAKSGGATLDSVQP